MSPEQRNLFTAAPHTPDTVYGLGGERFTLNHDTPHTLVATIMRINTRRIQKGQHPWSNRSR